MVIYVMLFERGNMISIQDENSRIIYSEVGKKIREAREGLDLTQKQLASRVGLNRSSIANIERGNHKILLHTFLMLSRALDKSPFDLMPDVSFDNGLNYLSEAININNNEKKWIAALVNDSYRKDL